MYKLGPLLPWDKRKLSSSNRFSNFQHFSHRLQQQHCIFITIYLTMFKTLKLRGAVIAAVLCMTDTCLGIDPRLVKSSLASASLLLNRESGGKCPNVQPLEGSKDATVGKLDLLLIRTPLIAKGSSNHISPLSTSKMEPATVVPSSTNPTAKGIAKTVSTPKGA